VRWRSLFSNRLLLILLAVSVACAIAGPFLGAKAFGQNVLAEVIGAVVGVVLALTLVDAMLARDRRVRWETVSAATVRAIGDELFRIAWAAGSLASPRLPPLPGVSSNRAHEALSIMKTVGETIQAHRRQQRVVEKDAQSGPAALLFPVSDVVRAIEAHTQRLNGVLMPRVLTLADDAKLVELLLAVEKEELDLRVMARERVRSIEWHWVETLVNAATKAYAYLVEHYPEAVAGRTGARS
jgi:hypothetical protein